MIFVPFGGNAQLGPMFLLSGTAWPSSPRAGKRRYRGTGFSPGRETVRHFHTSRFTLDPSMG
jgi:hypothetical protein